MNIKDFNLIIEEYDNKLKVANREAILVVAYSKELEKEIEELKGKIEGLDK